jgi:hypothetical protein
MRKVILFISISLFLCNSYADVGFLSDYDKLTKVQGGYEYISPTFLKSGGKIDSIMLDLPEMFISEKSKYKGLKPEQLDVWGKTFRMMVIHELEKTYKIVDQAGESVIYARPALTNIVLKKRKRGLLSYTPVGAITHAAVNAKRNFQKKVSLIELGVEIEFTHSMTGEVLGMTKMVRGSKKEPTDWQDVELMFQWVGANVNCELIKLKASDQRNCLEPGLIEGFEHFEF